jgi:hypothetical protein
MRRWCPYWCPCFPQPDSGVPGFRTKKPSQQGWT